MQISNLKFTGFDCVPEHMEQLGMIAKSLGLTRSALLRLLIARYVQRELKKQAAK
jgi:hypothetical protein